MNLPEPKQLPVSSTVVQLKENEQDYEWYPTTDRILETIKQDMAQFFNDRFDEEYKGADLLDIGAGDGRALKYLTRSYNKRYAIEKSKILIDQMDRDIFIIGTDFLESTLIDKASQAVFSNPPYKHFSIWTQKIILEAKADIIYLVIPERWKDDIAIKQALESRGVEARIIDSFDFLDAPRKARAKVDIIAVNLSKERHGHRSQITDPFDVWFENTFQFEAQKCERPDYEKRQSEYESLHEKVNHELIEGRNLIEILVSLYNKEMETLNLNYLAVSKLDKAILKELDVNTDALKSALKQKLEGCKHKYWKEFFSNYDALTDRLTKSSRESMINTLYAHTSVDFSESNCYALTMWAIKNANKYYDSQLISVVEKLVDIANVKVYKSNQKTFENEDWRYTTRWDLRKKITHYGLDYRIVLENAGGLKRNEDYEYRFPHGLNESAHDLLDDIITIANNLDFGVPSWVNSRQMKWDGSDEKDFMINVGHNKKLMAVRAYKNQNLHVKLNKEFLIKLNVTFGALKGWVKSKEQASEELDIPLKDVPDFDTNFQLGNDTVNQILLGCD
jgi:hypothetical protein